MKLLFITSGLEPGSGGVADYTGQGQLLKADNTLRRLVFVSAVKYQELTPMTNGPDDEPR